MSKTKSPAWEAQKKARWEERHQAQLAIEAIASVSRDDYARQAADVYDAIECTDRDGTLARDEWGYLAEVPAEVEAIQDRLRALGGFGLY